MQENRHLTIFYSFLVFVNVINLFLQIFLNFSKWILMDLLTSEMWLPIEYIFNFLFIILILFNIFYSFFRFKKYENFSFIPFAISIITLIFIFFVPLRKLSIDIDFKKNFEKRENIVQLIKNKSINNTSFKNENLITLPKEYKTLSKGGGEVLTNSNKTVILFFTHRSILDNFSAYVYSDSDKQEDIIKESFFGEIVKIERKTKNWYWVLSK